MQEVYHQLFCLLIFIITGIMIGILFDLFRIWRKSFKTADWITYLQDVAFWVLAGCIMLFSIFTFNNGEIRSYVFIGILLGIILYMLAISRLFVKSSVMMIQFLKKIFSYPIHLIEKILKGAVIKPASLLLQKMKNSIQKNDKKLHNFTKVNLNQDKKHKTTKKKKEFKEKCRKKYYSML